LQRNSAKLGANAGRVLREAVEALGGPPRGQSASLAIPIRATGAFRRRNGATTPTTTPSSNRSSRVAHLEELVEGAELDAQAKGRARFAVRQWIDAMCPANFAATNPEAMRQALGSRGEA